MSGRLLSPTTGLPTSNSTTGKADGRTDGDDAGKPDHWCIDHTDLELANEPAPARDRFLVVDPYLAECGREFSSREEAESAAAAELVENHDGAFLVAQIVSKVGSEIKIERIA